MENYKPTDEFSKELSKLKKKYQTLDEDLDRFGLVITQNPTGEHSKKFTVLHNNDGKIFVVKARLACRTLRGDALRIIYAYHTESAEFQFIYLELYAKNKKASEDRERIASYLKSLDE